MRKLFLFAFFFCTSLLAESKYPVDVTYVVADLKYSQEHGIKICEIQHGILSTFFGDVFVNGGSGLMSPRVVNVFTEFQLKKWTVHSQISFATLRSLIENDPDWITRDSVQSIWRDQDFLHAASLVPDDPYDISSYYGMLYIRGENIRDYDAFREQYPGIILIDAPSHPYWIDKYKMSLLFKKNSLLSHFKPEWNSYPKEYTKTLSQRIMDDIPSDLYVIKPRGSFLGNGVIITSKEDLDDTLEYILKKSNKLQNDPDHSYNHWYHDWFDTFIVEKYYPSDEIELNGKVYQPTMRVAFIMIYDKKQIDFRFVGGYWLVPERSINDKGTLNQIYKAYCKPPLFTHVSEEDLRGVEQQLEIFIPLFYREMLEGPL
jgi:hypothetical protein